MPASLIFGRRTQGKLAYNLCLTCLGMWRIDARVVLHARIHQFLQNAAGLQVRCKHFAACTRKTVSNFGKIRVTQRVHEVGAHLVLRRGARVGSQRW